MAAFFFFFKQMTAYDIRISYWSSDVCSSDLPRRRRAPATALDVEPRPADARARLPQSVRDRRDGGRHPAGRSPASARSVHGTGGAGRYRYRRSEEHTSELQSLMRISYAVFCLKKQTSTPQQNHTPTRSDQR